MPVRKLLAVAAALGALLAVIAVAGCSDDKASGPASGFPTLNRDTIYDSVIAGLSRASTTDAEIVSSNPSVTWKFRGPVRFDGDSLEFQLVHTRSEDPRGQAIAIFVDDTWYLTGTGLQLPDGKDWLKITAKEAAENKSIGSAVGLYAEQADPEHHLAFLEAATSVRFVGMETRDGVELARYEITVDPKNPRPGTSQEILDQLKVKADAGAPPAQYILLLDKNNLVHHFEEHQTLSEGEIGRVLDFRHWGDAVDIKAPDQSEVITYADYTASR